MVAKAAEQPIVAATTVAPTIPANSMRGRARHIESVKSAPTSS
jgi:hypothetical protein